MTVLGFEAFKPKLKRGKITPQDSKLIFELEESEGQIILPIQLVEFLLLCDGQRSIREIIEIIYKKQKTIHFRSIYNAVFYLRDQGFFENGAELESPSHSRKSSRNWIHSFPPTLFSLNLKRRWVLKSNYPSLFYLLSMGLIVLGILSLERFSLRALSSPFLRSDNSYLVGLLKGFLVVSVILSFRGLSKSFLTALLTGRIYSLRLWFNGMAFTLDSGSETLGLVNNRFYLILLYLGTLASTFAGVALTSMVDPTFSGSAWLLCFILLLADLDPFRNTLFNQLLLALYDDEGVVRLGSYLKTGSFLNLTSLDLLNKTHPLMNYISFYAMGWLLTATVTFSKVLAFNLNTFSIAFKADPLPSRTALLLILLVLVLIGALLIQEALQGVHSHLIRPLVAKMRSIRERAQVKVLGSKNMRDLLPVLEDLPLFNYFNEESLKEIIRQSELKTYPAGTMVIRQGELGTHLYVLIHGKVMVQKRSDVGKSQGIQEIHPVTIFGEMAVIEQAPRAAEVVALEESVVLAVPGDHLRQAAKDSQYIREIHDFKNAIMVNQFFTSAPMFRDLGDEVIQLFLSRGKIEHFAPRQIVFDQGSRGQKFYLVIRGSVRVEVDGRIVGKIRQGGFFGEIAVIADLPRTATISAIEPTILLSLHSDAFWEILSHDVEMAMFIEAAGEERMRQGIELLNASRNS